jgi:hypothetical protein
MPDKYISCEAALMKLMQDGCSAKKLAIHLGYARRRRCGGATWAVDSP